VEWATAVVRFSDEFRREAVALLASSVRPLTQSSWASRRRCCAIGAVGLEGGMRSRRCAPVRLCRLRILAQTQRHSSPDSAARTTGRAWSAPF
jgi:hypothetical protein